MFAICPWITDTPMIDRLTGHQADGKRQFAAVNPSGMIVAPADVAAVVLRLFTGDAGVENGGALLVDAGGAAIPVTPTAAYVHVT